VDQNRLLAFLPQPLGNLPGDIRIEREGFRMYVPVTTCIVLSGLFWLVQFLMNRSVP
jgi:hypothetical protein